MLRPACLLGFTFLTVAAVGGQSPQPKVSELPLTVEFNRDIRPILSNACFQCHGPDSARRKADLRLDAEKEATMDRGGYRVIVPGKPEQSELWKRIVSKDPGQRMPPAKANHHLSQREMDLVKRWLEQGAKYQAHWSFIPPERPSLPVVKNRNWPRNPIDHFILARLEKEGLQPAPEADRITLLRRVTLDLTGLPPTLKEVEDFLNDKSPNAYEKVVDRLLASPRYGERMAHRWLDGARYADTNGYQSDGERIMWRWRDWVIEAFNSNRPFDQFTIEQIAGDLLPNPTLEQKIATGFNRNHRGNAEGGVIPEEYAVEYVVDRVDTTATVFLGLTAACGRCHDHKYDPITQKEFYQLFAYFNNVPERGKAIKYGNSPPLIKSPTRAQQKQLTALKAQLTSAEQQCAALEDRVRAGMAQWAKELGQTRPVDSTITEGLSAHYPFEGRLAEASGRHRQPHHHGKGQPVFAPSPMGQGVKLAGSEHINCGDVGNFGFFDRFSIAAWIHPTDERGGSVVARMQDTDRAEGYNLALEQGHVHVQLIKRWLDDAIRVETAEKVVPPQTWTHVLVTYDGTRLASGIRVYVNGEPVKLKVNLDDINQSFATDAPLRIGRGGGAGSEFVGLMDEVRLYERCLTPQEVAIVANPHTVTELARLAPAQRRSADALKLRWHYLHHAAPEPIRTAYQRLHELQKEWQKLDDEIPTTMVMEEMNPPRETHFLIRGEYDRKGPKVQPTMPASLPPLPPGAPNNRLGFARWLVHPSNPLTARVAVNRFWQMLFGTGLVKTVEDFGSQGEWPSHPQLLDWLAREFQESGVRNHAQRRAESEPLDSSTGKSRDHTPWDVKRLLKLIVTSATYRQSSRVTPALLARDPENRLLARGPRYRLPAEMIRDQALFVSGLLVEKLGGPSVKPYQPAGIWKDLAGVEYTRDKGASLYRRSLYTFWKRTIAPPNLMIFDAAGRETCVVRETRTNTPLQALTLLNEVAHVEAARMLAERMFSAGNTPTQRVTYGFRLVTSRPPRPQELRILLAGLEQYRLRYWRDPTAGLRLLAHGDAPRNPQLDPSEHAAYTVLANLLLNLDEAITKQ